MPSDSFVFLDAALTPWRVGPFADVPAHDDDLDAAAECQEADLGQTWVFYWHVTAMRWVPLREAGPGEFDSYPRMNAHQAALWDAVSERHS